MADEMIVSGRKRRARALELELEALLERVRRGDGDIAELLNETRAVTAELEATRSEPDGYVCFGCEEAVDPGDLLAGGVHFCRMSRHNETDKVVAKGTAEVKFCADCYTRLHAWITGQSVTAERESLKAARAERAQSPRPE